MKTYKEKLVDFLKLEQNKIIILLSIVTIILGCFLYIDGIAPGADLDYHLNRIYEISENIKCGDILSLTYKNTNGYGSGLFYPQVFLYIPAILVTLGIDLIISYKVFLFICNTATIFITYFCVYSLTNNRKIGVTTSLLYATCCYRFAMSYWVAAVGMVEAFVFLPVVVLGMYEVFYRNEKKWFVLTIGIVGIIYSHLISVVLVVLFICLPVFLINIKKLKDKKVLKALVLAILLTILLTLGFVVGFLEQIIKYDFVLDTASLSVEPADTLVPFPFNIIGIYNSKYNVEKESNQFYGVGVGSVIFVLSTVFVLINIKKKYVIEKEKQFINLLYVLATFYVFAICIRLFWENIGIFSLIQFPHRFQLINSFIFSYITGYAIHYIFFEKTSFFKELGILIITLTIVFNFWYTHAMFILPTDKYELNYMKNKGTGMEYLPASIKYKDVEKVNDLPKAINENILFNFKIERGKYVLEYSKNIDKDNEIILPIYYYEGYKIIESSNEKSEIINKEDGYIHIKIHGENGKIVFKYNGTRLLKISYAITFIVYIVIIVKRCLGSIYPKKYYKKITKI